MSYKVGLIGMIREELERDRWGTLRDMARHGYHGIESSLSVGETLNEVRETRKQLDDIGFEMAGLSCSHRDPDKLDDTIERARILGAPHILTYYGPVESEDQLKKEAEVLESMAVKCADAGLKFCYHNHDHEFANRFGRNGNTYAIEVLLENAPHLHLQLDVAWCAFGGCDPVEYIRRMGHRIPVIHVKDVRDLTCRGRWTTVGMGKVDCVGCIEAAAAKGTAWMVVEQDQPNALSHYESAVAAIWNLREAGVVPPRS